MTIRQFVKKVWDSKIVSTKGFRFLSLTILDSWAYVPLKKYLSLDKLVLFWKVSAYAQQNYASLANAYDLTLSVESNNLEGAVVECGVWRGGCSAVMAAVLEKSKSNRKVWLFDSFEGMPQATKVDIGDDARGLSCGAMFGRLAPVGTNVASVDEVKTLMFTRLHLSEDNVTIVKGWFQNTLPLYRTRIGPIALLRIDADWYESTKICLECLFDNVVNEGYVVIDDYGFFPGCKKAVDEFLDSRGLKVQFTAVDYSRVYFKKVRGTSITCYF